MGTVTSGSRNSTVVVSVDGQEEQFSVLGTELARVSPITDFAVGDVVCVAEDCASVTGTRMRWTFAECTGMSTTRETCTLLYDDGCTSTDILGIEVFKAQRSR